MLPFSLGTSRTPKEGRYSIPVLALAIEQLCPVWCSVSGP
ncbi:hypothetical protein LINPERPRIM_LOCUS486, partial [Linum perenne]